MKTAKKPRKGQGNRPTAAAPREESRVSIVITVGWMLGALATFAAEVVGVGVRTAVMVTQSMPAWLQAASEILFLVALVVGLMTLLITPLCFKVRQVPPPKPITFMVIGISAMPWLVLFLRVLAN